MAIQFECPHCAATLQAKDDAIGKELLCSRCHKRLLVPYPPISNPRSEQRSPIFQFPGLVASTIANAPSSDTSETRPHPAPFTHNPFQVLDAAIRSTNDDKIRKQRHGADISPRKRPVSVTAVSWGVILGAGIILVVWTAFFSIPSVRANLPDFPAPMQLKVKMLYIGLIVVLVCGIGMLNGQHWARILLVILSAIVVLSNLAMSPSTNVVFAEVPTLVSLIFFLFSPNANRYFSVK